MYFPTVFQVCLKQFLQYFSRFLELSLGFVKANSSSFLSFSLFLNEEQTYIFRVLYHVTQPNPRSCPPHCELREEYRQYLRVLLEEVLVCVNVSLKLKRAQNCLSAYAMLLPSLLLKKVSQNVSVQRKAQQLFQAENLTSINIKLKNVRIGRQKT